jgi:5-methylcytosine-specific restriction endonuclease McrA
MVKLNRKNIYARDLNTCQYCGKKLPADKLNLDHVVPRSMGGKNSWTNLVCTCHECNTMKGNRRPHEAGMKLLRKPEKPVFHSLFFHYIPPDKYDSWKHFLPQMPKPAMAVKES